MGPGPHPDQPSHPRASGWRSIGWRSTPVHRVLFTSLPRSAAERWSEGSNPGGVPERPKGADCKSAGSAFPGSNPGAATLGKTPSGLRKRRPEGVSSCLRSLPFVNKGPGAHWLHVAPSPPLSRVPSRDRRRRRAVRTARSARRPGERGTHLVPGVAQAGPTRCGTTLVGRLRGAGVPRADAPVLTPRGPAARRSDRSSARLPAPARRSGRRPAQLPATDFTATDTGAGPLISSRVRPAVAGVSTSSASTAATSSRGMGPRPVWASRRTRPVPASLVS